MEVLPTVGKNILNRLGIIKNELLIFVVLIVVILNGSAVGLESGTRSHVQEYGGLIMHLSSVPIALLAIAFYIYAYLNLPTSSQEWVFTKEARVMEKEHDNRRRKAGTKKANA